MPVEQVTVIAEFRALPGDEDHVRRTLVKMIEPTRREPGNINYDLHQVQDDPTVFFFTTIGAARPISANTCGSRISSRWTMSSPARSGRPYSVTLLTMISDRETAA